MADVSPASTAGAEKGDEDRAAGRPVFANGAAAKGYPLPLLDGRSQQIARIEDPLDGVAFEAVIVSSDDHVAMVGVLRAHFA